MVKGVLLGGKKLTGPTVSAHLSSLTLSLLDRPKTAPSVILL